MKNLQETINNLHESINRLAEEMKSFTPEEVYRGLADNIDAISDLGKNFINLVGFIDDNFSPDPARRHPACAASLTDKSTMLH